MTQKPSQSATGGVFTVLLWDQGGFMKRIESRKGGLLPWGLALLALAGCDRVSALIGRSGASLEAPLKSGQESSWRVLVESSAPAPSAGTGAKAGTITARIDLKLRTKLGAEEADGWLQLDGEVLEGRYEVDQQARGTQLVGQKMTGKINGGRRLSRWQGPAFPSGLELLEIAPPKGRVKKGEQWKVEIHRQLLQQQQDVVFDKFYTYQGEASLDAEPCDRLSVSIAATKRLLSTGTQVEFTGNGETWVSRKDGRVLKATEVLEGQVSDDKVPGSAGRFAQAITLMDDALAPAMMPSLIETSVARPAAPPTPAGATAAPGAAAPAQAPSPKPPVNAPPTATPSAAPAADRKAGAALAVTGTGTGDRLIFVSHATGKPEVWSVAPGGEDKRCVTGFEYAHWAPAMEPDGRSMACVVRRPSGVNLASVSLVSGDEAQLTEFGERDDLIPGWSLGGQRLVFLKSGKLWSIHHDGDNLQSFALTGNAISFAATAANGTIAVVTNELNLDKIFTVDVMSGAIRELFEGDEPSWSPDGSRLAYRSGETVNTSNADGSGPRLVMKGLTQDGPLLWDPAGKRLACTIQTGTEANVALIDDSTTTTVTRVTSRGGTAAAFSPAGDRIAYLLNGDVWIATTDGNVQTRVTADGASELPVWWGKPGAR